MINKITKLKSFGIFHDFTWNTGVPDFNKFNLIYGWNRSGKTTLSRVFSACEQRTNNFKQYPSSGEFEISKSDGSLVSSAKIDDCSIPIKVFNKDFVDNNISFDPTDPFKPIVYISEEDIESKKKLEQLRKENQELDRVYQAAKREKENAQTLEDNFRISVGQSIRSILTTPEVNDIYKNYDKSNVRNILEKEDNFEKLREEDISAKKALITSKAKSRLPQFEELEIDLNLDGTSIMDLDGLSTVITHQFSREIIAETLDRLKDDSALNKWVKDGYELHKLKVEEEKCLFCQNRIGKELFASFSKHFSQDYENLEKNLNKLISKLDSLKEDIKKDTSEIKVDLYPDLQSEYQKQVEMINFLTHEMNHWIDETVERLKNKINNPYSIIIQPEIPKDFLKEYNKILKGFNRSIEAHNVKVDKHSSEVSSAKKALEKHYTAEAIEEHDYRRLVQNLEKCKADEKKAKEELDANITTIQKLEQRTSDIGQALKKINTHLENFFGRNEIQLELNENQKGYVLKRDEGKATNLSEGEKTAIALSYFIVKTQERDFKVKDSIIFIDDPISSLDLNFIYHCFSLIKNHFKEAGQLFISTHNFQFFNLCKFWFCRKNDNRKQDGKPPLCEFYMVENYVDNNKRYATIKQLEETLLKFQSEYHYLFYKLKQFIENASPTYAEFYSIGNIARRFIEIYTNFKIPTTDDLWSKITKLEVTSIDDTEKDRVYKLMHEFSHGDDPTSSIEHKDKTESKEAIKNLLEIVKQSDLKHYELLEKSIA